MNRELFNKIVVDGIKAPSGDNFQPWKIVPNEDLSGFKISPRKVNDDFFNVKNIASYISIGAFLKNVEVSSHQKGFRTEIKYSKKDPIFVKVLFKEDRKKSKNDLYSEINGRYTSREKYLREKLDERFYDDLILEYKDAQMKLFKGREKKILSKVIYHSEIIRLETKGAKITLTNAIKTSRREINSREGLDYRTLGIPLFPKITALYLKSLSFSKINSLFKLNGIISFISSLRLLNSSEGIGVILSDSYSSKSAINVGYLLEDFWLRLTRYKGSLQPFASYPFFAIRIKTYKKHGINNKQIKKMQCMSNEIENTFKGTFGEKKILFLFRYGRAKKCNIKTLRKNLDFFIR